MKLAVILILAAILLAGCEAKSKKKGKPGPKKQEELDPHDSDQCKPLSKMVGYTGHHDFLHGGALIACYEAHSYDNCHLDMDDEEMRQTMLDCEAEIKIVIQDISDKIGINPLAEEVESLFSLERHARRTGTRGTGTRTTGSRGTRVSSVCSGFSSNVVSFLESIRSRLPYIIRAVSRCFSGSRSNLVTCLFNFFIDFIAPFIRNGFIRCLLSLFGL